METGYILFYIPAELLYHVYVIYLCTFSSGYHGNEVYMLRAYLQPIYIIMRVLDLHYLGGSYVSGSYCVMTLLQMPTCTQDLSF